MIRNLWHIASFMAIVHLLALLMFVGWLWNSGRLSHERLVAARDLFAPTIEQQAAATLDAEVAERREAEELRARNRVEDPPLPSGSQVAHIVRTSQAAQQAQLRVEDQSERLMERLDERARVLDEREASLEARQEAWARAVKKGREQQTEEQFQKAVSLYESVPAKQAKRMLVELVAQGSTDQAVAYLDAMNTRAASKVLKELKTDEENQLATELLERIRTLGQNAEGPENASDANTPASSGSS